VGAVCGKAARTVLCGGRAMKRTSLPLQRREFIVGLAGAAAWPVAARAQQPERMRRIGVLVAGGERDREVQRRIAAFQDELQKIGWLEPRNVKIEKRWAAPGDTESNQRFAYELVEQQPDVIFASSTPPTAALLKHTRDIPIVFATVNDPIGSGFVESFPRPGGNATGFVILEPTIGGKWLELLRDMAPRINRVTLLFNPAQAPTAEYYLNSFKAAAEAFAVEANATQVRDRSEFEQIVAAAGLNGGLAFVPDAFMTAHRVEIISLAARYRVPAVYPFRPFVESGGLISYGPDIVDQFRQAAGYVDRLLKGAKANELPVQGPAKFELTINLKTAKALGLEVPATLIARADEVIE
jgi:putative ABC transport system substrate-binding protein